MQSWSFCARNAILWGLETPQIRDFSLEHPPPPPPTHTLQLIFTAVLAVLKKKRLTKNHLFSGIQIIIATRQQNVLYNKQDILHKLQPWNYEEADDRLVIHADDVSQEI